MFRSWIRCEKTDANAATTGTKQAVARRGSQEAPAAAGRASVLPRGDDGRADGDHENVQRELGGVPHEAAEHLAEHVVGLAHRLVRAESSCGERPVTTRTTRASAPSAAKAT